MSMRMKRRTLLRAGSAALSLPLLQAMGGRAWAAPPRRLLFFYTPNGTFPERFWPLLPGQAPHPIDQGTAPGVYVSGATALDTTGFSLPEITAPLTPHQKDLIFLEGIDHCSGATRNKGPFDGHPNAAGLLSGRLVEQDGTLELGPGITVDQVLANQIGGATKFPSLALGVRSRQLDFPGYALLSWPAPGRSNPPQNDPRKVFTRLFADLTTSPAELAALRRERRSVLDATLGQMKALQGRLGLADGRRLGEHADAVREVERRLDVGLGPAASPATCHAPVLEPLDPERHEDVPAITRAQIDMTVLALACDLTRVAVVQNSCEQGDVVHSWLGINEEHHGITHCGDDDVASYAKITAINTWYAQQFAYLIARLEATPEGSGSLFDSTLVVWLHGITKGANHSNDNLPLVLAGGLQGTFRTGRYVRLARPPGPAGVRPKRSRSLADLHATLLAAMGAPQATFGDPLYFGGALRL
jgi:hypothetical protein